MLIYAGHIAVRFKKFDERLQPSNNETPQSRSFTGGTIADCIPASVTLDCGYTLDEFGEAITGVYLVQRESKKSCHWVIEIAEEMKTIVTPLFNEPDEEMEETPAAVVPKKSEVVQLRPTKTEE